MQWWVGALVSSTISVTINIPEGFEHASYILNEINCVYVIVEENGVFQLMPPPATVSNLMQTRVADLGSFHYQRWHKNFSIDSLRNLSWIRG
jgi:hypothetical protein